MDAHTAENHRRNEHLLRPGTVFALDYGRALCRVRSGDIQTDWLPWFVPRAGETIEWSAPSIGEQVLLLSPAGDTHGAIALRGIYSSAYPAPADQPYKHLTRYRDGATVSYDDQAHAMEIILPAGGTLKIVATGGTTIIGDVDITGTVTVSQDVIAAGISLTKHVHGGVVSGPGDTGKPK